MMVLVTTSMSKAPRVSMGTPGTWCLEGGESCAEASGSSILLGHFE